MTDCTGHANGFDHLDLDVPRLKSEYHLGWKVAPATDGPPGFDREPYIPLWVSVEIRTGDSLRTVASRLRTEPLLLGSAVPLEETAADGPTLQDLVVQRLPDDLRELDAGREPEALRRDSSDIPRKFLRP